MQFIYFLTQLIQLMVFGLNRLAQLDILVHKFIYSDIEQSVLYLKRQLIRNFLDFLFSDSGQFYGFCLKVGFELF